MGNAPYPPRDRAAQFDRSEIDHRLALADLRQAAGVAVTERRRRFAAQARPYRCGDMASLLLGRGRNAGDRFSVRARDDDRVADREYIGVAGYGEVGQDLQSAGAVGRRTQPFGGR